jgi:hypothetical protein
MPPNLALLLARAPSYGSRRPSVCLFCSLSRSTWPTTISRRQRRIGLSARRLESTAATSLSAATPHPDPRKELENALADLGKHAASFVNLSRLQLALNGLRQTSGSESIRVAISGLANGSDPAKVARQVLKLLLADPLSPEQGWERELERLDLTKPVIVRVGAVGPGEAEPMSVEKGGLLQEVHIPSPTLNGHNLEILLTEANAYAAADSDGTFDAFEDAVLVPTIDIPTSSTGRYTPVTAPVHKALIVAEGMAGAISVGSLPLLGSEDMIKAAVDLSDYRPAGSSQLPFTPVDVASAESGLGLVRKDLGSAMEYERLWFQSNIPKLVEWLKAGVLTTSDQSTKPPLRRLISSLLQNTSASIQREEAQRVSASLASSIDRRPTRHLKGALADWAETAHTELQQQLDIAFSSTRWRRLRWWTLFWRVDDVGMLTTDILSQRFLNRAEKNAVYLAGRIEEAGVTPASGATYALPNSIETTELESPESTEASGPLPLSEPSPWPTNITAARAYLQDETIPALQALGQKLVIETLGTSGLTTSLGALVYFGTLTTSLSEAGAVAALGIVWSMRRMQRQWDTARAFWEGEVREEGRKAVKGVEMAVGKVLEKGGSAVPLERNAEGTRAQGLVDKATAALERMR